MFACGALEGSVMDQSDRGLTDEGVPIPSSPRGMKLEASEDHLSAGSFLLAYVPILRIRNGIVEWSFTPPYFLLILGFHSISLQMILESVPRIATCLFALKRRCR